MAVRGNVWSFSSLRLTVQATPPLHQLVVRRLLLAFVFVKTCACFAAQHLLIAQPKNDAWDVIALTVSLFECVTDIDRNIDADFIDQSQWSHRHSPFDQGPI